MRGPWPRDRRGRERSRRICASPQPSAVGGWSRYWDPRSPSRSRCQPDPSHGRALHHQLLVHVLIRYGEYLSLMGGEPQPQRFISDVFLLLSRQPNPSGEQPNFVDKHGSDWSRKILWVLGLGSRWLLQEVLSGKQRDETSDIICSVDISIRCPSVNHASRVSAAFIWPRLDTPAWLARCPSGDASHNRYS
jgi:hypothetical protein